MRKCKCGYKTYSYQCPRCREATREEHDSFDVISPFNPVPYIDFSPTPDPGVSDGGGSFDGFGGGDSGGAGADAGF